MATNQPQTFRKKPVVIEAMHLTGTPVETHAVYQWIETNTLGSFEPMAVIEGREPYPASGVSLDPRDGRMIISTLEGLHWADPEDWIIRGVKGEFYPCKPDVFETTYAAASDEDEKTGPVSHVFETVEELYSYAENGHFNALALLREADGRAWIYFEGEDGPMCLRPWDEDEEALTRATSGTHVVACFSEIDGFAYPVTVTADYFAPRNEETH